MTLRRFGLVAGFCGLTAASAAKGDALMTEDFNTGDPSGWSFFTDQVMGGVSTGRAKLETEAGATFLHLVGRVSTKNNGGFIQVRWTPAEPVPETARGVEIEVRGNGQTYYLHLRTRATRLPWQFYQAPIDVTQDWAVLRVPFADFVPKGRLLRNDVAPGALRSLAVAAYGRDHEADVSIRRIGFY